MSTATLPEITAESEIAEALAGWTKAFCSKDLDALMSFYADDVVEFDVKPPLQIKGRAAVRQVFAECFPCFPERFSLEIRDQSIHTAGGSEGAGGAGQDGGVAAIHRCTQVICDDQDHPAAQNWLRVTAVYRKIGGQWKIVHDHVSFTFDFSKGQIAFGLQP